MNLKLACRKKRNKSVKYDTQVVQDKILTRSRNGVCLKSCLNRKLSKLMKLFKKIVKKCRPRLEINKTQNFIRYLHIKFHFFRISSAFTNVHQILSMQLASTIKQVFHFLLQTFCQERLTPYLSLVV